MERIYSVYKEETRGWFKNDAAYNEYEAERAAARKEWDVLRANAPDGAPSLNDAATALGYFDPLNVM